MKKHTLTLFVFCILSLATVAQKVAAVADLTKTNIDSVSVPKGKPFVVQMPVHNRKGDDWYLAKPSTKCNFTQTKTGEAGTLPDQAEIKLFFFKAAEQGQDTIRFIYKQPKADTSTKPAEKVLIVSVQ